MKTRMKRAGAMILAGAMAMSCLGSVSASAAEPKKTVIGVAFYNDSSKPTTATKAYLESLADALNVEFKYTVFTQTDESANLTKIQELISAGAEGIIGTIDLGTTAIVEECEAAGVYYAGYLCDFDTSYQTAYEAVYENPYFLGTISDGHNPDDIVLGTQTFESVMEYNERNPENPLTHMAMIIFPDWAYPAQAKQAEQFVEEIEKYNETAETPITVDPIDAESDVIPFTPLDSTYFSKHPDIDAIASFAAGTSFVYPTMVASGVDGDLKLFTTGFEGGEEENFGSAGKGTFQQNVITAIETVTYPLVLLLNQINGVEFADMPETAERIGCDQIIINSDEDLEKFLVNIYNTGDAAGACWTGEDVLKMTAFGNPDATYADLVEAVTNLTLDNM
ncbi:MAG: hypothetical protein Q4F41_03350 [Eubacteriales bacterium]|nr:hypothetical protein [Eubacteriales bacterium]